MNVSWTYQPTRWIGDDFGGSYVIDGPKETLAGTVRGYVVKDQQTLALVQRGVTLVEIEIERLKVI